MIIQITVEIVDDEGRVIEGTDRVVGKLEKAEATAPSSITQWFLESFIKVKMSGILKKGG
jgi:hypothetical protein